MRLYIAEKPSLGRAIADVLPKPHRRGEGFIEVGNGDRVSWCIGHLLEQAEPDAYDAAYKKWKLEDLPIVPQQWKLKAKSKTRKQLSVLRKLIKEADQLIHAGDPDREGQLLVDEVIDYVGAKTILKQSTLRCLISDLNPSAVKRALNSMRKNSEFIPLSVSALARSRADWLFGMNMTRAYTVQGQKVGYRGVLSVGRVQTPVLGLVVRRDLEIETFVSRPFYDVEASLVKLDGTNGRFKAKWKPSEACAPYQDDEGRILHKPLAENVCARIQDKQGTVDRLEQKNKQQPPPLPYSLSALQIDAAKAFGLSAKQVLDICQGLYERHKLITYPRSDSRYLPKEHHQQGKSIVSAIASNLSELKPIASQADFNLRSRAWNDSKVDAHHGIIPTEKTMNASKLSKQEKQVYECISKQYLMQFFSPYEYLETKVQVVIEGGIFQANARQPIKIGWKILIKKNDKDNTDLPPLHQGERLLCEKAELLTKETQPPAHYTDATILAAMTGISRYVENKDIRKILKDTDGIGTEATRAGIIELLFKRGFLIRNGRKICATPAGIGLVKSLPEATTKPDMTAHWESKLNGISERQLNYQNFMEPLTKNIYDLIQQASQNLPQHLQGVTSTSPKRKSSRKKNFRPKSSSKKSSA